MRCGTSKGEAVRDRLDYLFRSKVYEKLREQITHLDSQTAMSVLDNCQRALFLVKIIGPVAHRLISHSFAFAHAATHESLLTGYVMT